MVDNRALPDDGGPRMSLRAAMTAVPRIELVAMAVIAVPLAVGVVLAGDAGGVPSTVTIIPAVAIAVGVPLVARSSIKAHRAGYSPIPHLRAGDDVTSARSVEEVLVRAAEVVLRMPRCKPETLRRSSTELRVETGLSGPSWGEAIAVSAVPDLDGATHVHVTSRPLLRSNIFDSGTNQRNVRIIVNGVRELDMPEGQG